MGDLKYHRLDMQDGVARITLDRPKHNVLNIDMMTEFNNELEKLTADPELKCLVLLAEGRSWCAGVEVGDHKPEMVDGMIATFNHIFELFEQLEVPTIAAVHGACLGGGMELAIACDVVVATEKAKFGQPEIKLGFFPPYAAIRLPALVGPSRAIEICCSGKIYSADEARAMGLIAYRVESGDLAATVDGLVNEIAVCSPLIIRLNKRAVRRHVGLGFREALDGVSDLFLNTLMKTEDTLEGIRSFEEKCRPQWRNR